MLCIGVLCIGVLCIGMYQQAAAHGLEAVVRVKAAKHGKATKVRKG